VTTKGLTLTPTLRLSDNLAATKRDGPVTLSAPRSLIVLTPAEIGALHRWANDAAYLQRFPSLPCPDPDAELNFTE
jgi:hypothetical protein